MEVTGCSKVRSWMSVDEEAVRAAELSLDVGLGVRQDIAVVVRLNIAVLDIFVYRSC